MNSGRYRTADVEEDASSVSSARSGNSSNDETQREISIPENYQRALAEGHQVAEFSSACSWNSLDDETQRDISMYEDYQQALIEAIKVAEKHKALCGQNISKEEADQLQEELWSSLRHICDTFQNIMYTREEAYDENFQDQAYFDNIHESPPEASPCPSLPAVQDRKQDNRPRSSSYPSKPVAMSSVRRSVSCPPKIHDPGNPHIDSACSLKRPRGSESDEGYFESKKSRIA